MMLYRARKLTKTAGERDVLNIDSLELEEGIIYGLLGANGAGKTTLLNILAFLEPPTSGSLEFAGQAVRFTPSALQRLRRAVVMVDQHPVLFSTTVYNNIEFGLKIRKVDPGRRERIIDEVLETVDLRSFKHEPAPGLSGGEIQRIALARALALSPKVLLCDEPTSSVDVENQAAIVAVLREINENRHISIIFTTHDRLQAAGLARETLVLEKGSLVTAAYENVFACAVTDCSADQSACRLNNRTDLLLPAGRMGIAREAKRIAIDPEKIILLRHKPETETKGILQGRVVQLMAEGERVRMIVDVGVLLTVLLAEDRYRTLHPAIGDTIYVQVLPEAISG